MWLLYSPPFDPGEEWYVGVTDSLDILSTIVDVLMLGGALALFLLAVHVVGSWGK